MQGTEFVKETVGIDQTHQFGVNLVPQFLTERGLRKDRIRIAHPFLRSESETEDDERPSDRVEHFVPETTRTRNWQKVSHREHTPSILDSE